MDVVGLPLELFLVAVIASIIQGIITLKWYIPPARNGKTPTPILEAVIFTGIFFILFFIIGSVLQATAGVFPPISQYLILVVSLIGFGIAWVSRSPPQKVERTVAERMLSLVVGLVLVVMPIVLQLP